MRNVGGKAIGKDQYDLWRKGALDNFEQECDATYGPQHSHSKELKIVFFPSPQAECAKDPSSDEEEGDAN